MGPHHRRGPAHPRRPRPPPLDDRVPPVRGPARQRGRRHGRPPLEPLQRPPAAHPRRHTRRIWSAAFSPDGSLLASAGDDGAIILWDVTDHTAPRPPHDTAGPGRGVGRPGPRRPLQVGGQRHRRVLVRRGHVPLRTRRTGPLPPRGPPPPLDAPF
ncbi:WD40 repeat domain-containing protein [Actinomadura madurae]|uniref:WD40 repeat domain-containing protein n=1 Tax=Actinomadura madurae TaxID=1993 RepID=UPI0020D22F8F|nr:WD40 repeat domain-containing protein [Actinomadura madurae]MCQ0020483.1 WD40 domain-containing protein [Actinomadura madurae]